ncbi:hypothetical protein SFC43_14010 [Bacteroides sp. CR5/BHMF/2]|nr:hypothetical protein [Bacteroides sp. CR5/BHMF/2]
MDYDHVIEVLHVYKYAHNQVIVSLPVLIPGEYFPAVKIIRKKSEDAIYIFPVSWVVMPEGHERESTILVALKLENEIESNEMI